MTTESTLPKSAPTRPDPTEGEKGSNLARRGTRSLREPHPTDEWCTESAPHPLTRGGRWSGRLLQRPWPGCLGDDQSAY